MTKVVVAVESTEVDRFASSGTSVERVGWKALDFDLPKASGRRAGAPRRTARWGPARVIDAKAVAKKTRPPPRLTDATLLTAMETAGREVERRRSPTRCASAAWALPRRGRRSIETLLKREYAERDGKTLKATDKGIALIDVVHPNVKTPAMTGEWEAKLAKIERGTADFDAFMRGIEGYVREVVRRRRGRSLGPVAAAGRTRGKSARRKADFQRRAPVSRRAPVASPGARLLLREKFGFASYKPFQEDVCRAAAAGRDVLARHADRRRQVPLLPASRARARRHHARRQPAHRAHGGPGREAVRARSRRRTNPLGSRPRGLARRVSRLSRRSARLTSSSRPSA